DRPTGQIDVVVDPHGTLLVFDALLSCCVKLSRRRRRVKSRLDLVGHGFSEHGKITPRTMTSTVDFDRLEYEKRVNLVIDHVSAHLAEDLSLVGLARVAALDRKSTRLNSSHDQIS